MNDSIYNLHNDNYINTSNSSFIIKLSGKGSLNTSNSNNIYNNNGIGFKLVNNTSNNREIAIVDSSNINNNYSILNIGIVNNSISLNNNVNIPIIFNSNVYFSNSSIAINSKNTNESININGNINLTSDIFLNNSVINLNSNFNNTTYFNSSNLIVLSNIILGGTIYKTDGSPFLGGGSSGLAQWNEYPFNPNNIYYQEGYVGIGITNPTSILHLHSNSINSDVSLRISNLILSKDSNQSAKLFNNENSSLIFGTNNNQSLIITSNGNIGINSSNSSEILTINGNLISSGLFLKSSNSIFFSSYLSNSSLNQNNIYYDIGSIGIGTSLISNKNSKLEINNNIICSNGFIGIGITNPNSYLHINSSNFNSSLKLQLYNLYLEKNSNHNILFYNYENSNLSLGTNGIERLSISSNGNIAIGNPIINNSSLLFINGNIILEGSLLNSNGIAITFNELSNSSINSNNIYYNNGLLGIGTNNPRGNSNVGLDIYNGNIVINNGFLGIGTNNPNSHLNIHSSQGILLNEINNKGIALFRDTNQNSLFWNYENNDLSLGTNGIERTIITETGSIGLGTSQPLGILDVRGNIILEGSLLNSNGTSISFLQLSNSSINSNNIYYNNGLLGIGTNNPRGNSNVGLDIYNGNIVINNGFLGIGTNNPNSHLNIHSSQGILLNEINNKGIALFRDTNQNSLFWNYENNDLSLGTNGIERTIITETGSIGLGTSQPLGILDVRGNIILEGSLLNSNGTSISFLQLSNSSINSNNIYYNLGSIGIGTTNPRVNLGLDIYNSNIVINNGFLGIDTNNPTSVCHLNSSLVSSSVGIQFTDFNNSQSSLKGFSLIKDNTQKTLLWNYENNDLSLGTNGIERTRITGIGSIGIGTSQPLGSLDIRGDIAIGGTLTKPDGTPISFLQLSNSSINANNIYYNLGSIGIGTNNPRNNGLDIYNNNCIVNNGLIGIGITNPNSVIHIHSSLGIQFTDTYNSLSLRGFGLIKDNFNLGLLWNYENSHLSLGTNGSEKLKITSNGLIGIGNENPSNSLDINGNITLSGSIIDSNNANINLSPFNNSSINNTYTIPNYIAYSGDGNTLNAVSGNSSYSYISFIDNGTLTLTTSIVCDILVVGGGGGGGGWYVGGGGGAGGAIYITNQTLSAGTYNIVVGNGGAGGINNSAGTKGGNSSFNGLIAEGGGFGGNNNNSVSGNGGCGGGQVFQYGSAGTGSQGFNGGSFTSSPANTSGGGGGMGGNTTNGNGGIGIQYNITGTNIYYCGGGGGGSDHYTQREGGLGGGGTGGGGLQGLPSGESGLRPPTAGGANTGGGGGGAIGNGTGNGANGGSGVVIIRFLNTPNTNIFYNGGNLGIGTSNPNASIDVNNNVILNNNIGIGHTDPNSKIHIHSSSSNTTIKLQLSDTNNGFSLIKNENQSGLLWNNENQDISIGISNIERIKIKNNGNIGIGSANPNQILDILGSNRANEYTIKGINVSNVIDSNILTTSNFLINYNNHLNIINSNLLLASSNAQNTYFTITNSSNTFLTNSSANTNYTTKIEYNNKQNTILYNFPLSNSQLIYDSGFTLTSSKLTKNNTLGPNSQWNNSNNNIVIINSNIGIGIATIPTTRLHIENSIKSTINSNSSIYIYNPNNSINNNSIISNKIGGSIANISSYSFDVDGVYGSSFYVKGNDSFKSLIFNKSWDANQFAGYNIFRINSNNNIGVSIEDPKSLLHLSSTSVSTSIPINLNNIITIEKTINQEGRINNSSANSSLLFGTNNNEILRITSNGTIGINNSNSNNYILNITAINPVFNFTGEGNTFNTVTNNNIYSYISFINSGTLTLNSSITCDILIVGGGGSGGFTTGGGGGGGKVVYITNAIITSGTYNIIVGDGGAINYSVNSGNKGGNSSFAGIIAEGGGGGSRYGYNASSGGSGGGAGADEIYSDNTYGGNIGTETFLNGYIGNIYGNIGGNSSESSSDPSLILYSAGGGGGGAGEIGQTGNINNNGAGGRGGNGIQINITGTNLYWGAGGGGSQHYSSDNGIISRGGNGGLGGGGGGSSGEVYYGLGGTGGLNNGESANLRYGGNGAPNTGSGGGGGSYSMTITDQVPYGGAGGSGIVIIRFLYINNGINFTDNNNILSNSTIAVFNNNLHINTSNNTDISFLTNNTSEKIRIKNNSNIGFGVTNPLSTLHINGNITLGSSNNSNSLKKTNNLVYYDYNENTAINNSNLNYTTNLNIKNYNLTSNNFTIPTPIINSSITYSGVNNTSNFVINNNNFNYITFINNGILTLSNAIVCDYLIVGGGGGGGHGSGGGGGAGGIIYRTNITIQPGTYNIIVGQGGIAGTFSIKQTNGENSSFNGDIGIGGGAGGSFYDNNSGASANGMNGGCGGGAASAFGYYTSGSIGVGSQGYNGSQYNNFVGGGGGGMGGNASGGGGGIGIQINITGINIYYSTGGNGGSDNNGANGTANTGNGGGGGGSVNQGGNGGSGIVIIRFNSSYYTASIPPIINYIANNNAYYQITTNAILYLNAPIISDILLVGAGGNGGSNLYSGGGGAGEVIYYPNYFLNTGTYNFTIGVTSNIINNRISKITYNSIDIINANGGGDGGSVNITYTGDGNTLNTVSGNSSYSYISFIDNGALILSSSILCDILIVGGGGAGSAGGGGAGGFVYRTNFTLTTGTYNIIVGLGGISSGSSNRGNDGNDSYIQLNGTDILRAYKGGGGANNGGLATAPNGYYGSTGGCGHDSGRTQNTFSSGTLIGGNIGGVSTASPSGWGYGGYQSAGGGGGAGGIGQVGVSGNGYYDNYGALGGAGGVGIQNSITGIATYYAGGGAGGTNINYTTTSQTVRPQGGLGGGGNGNLINNQGGTDAIANTGGGGGGSDWEYTSTSGNGGSGIVIIRFLNILNTNPSSGGSGGGGAINQTGAIAGNATSSSFSFLRAGNTGSSTVGGNGGSATAGGRYTTTITGSSLQVGLGGNGIGSSGSAVNGTNYGDGGSGNGGLGANGVIVLRIPTSGDTTLDLTSTITETNNLNCSNLINNNNTGILTSYNTIYPLEIANSTIANNFTTSSGFLESSGVATKTSNQPNITVKANGSIWSTSSFIASSDSRIKTNIQDINDKQALEKILKIEPKTYNYIDTLSKGTSNVYGFIAEQIKEVIPEAITITEETIPNIYLEGNIKENNEIIIENDKYSNININDDIRIITSNSDENYKIIKMNNIKQSFKIDRNINENKCFIYGTKVNNFNILDKNYLYTLNVGAIQELYKMITSNQDQLNIINEKINQLTYSK